jgi:hypothetical protein
VDALVLAGVGIWCFLVALTGGLLGLVLGNIRLPVFLLVGTNPAAAAGANIAVSGVAAAAASITHVRAGRIDWRLVGWMLPPSVLGALVGGYAGGHLPANVLNAVAEKDNVVPLPAAQPVMQLVGDPSRREELRLAGGHVTFGAGSQAFKTTLPALSRWLAEHSDELDPPKER